MLCLHSAKYRKKPNSKFKPDFIAKSVQDIDFELLRKYGIKSCLIDLDDTVVERANYNVDPSIVNALKQSGLDIYIATNRPKSRDLKELKKDLGATGVIHPHGLMGKPTKRYFLNGMRDKSLDIASTVMVGDRIIQDIFGANRAGIYSLLVYKLGKPAGKIDSLISSLERRWTTHIAKQYIAK